MIIHLFNRISARNSSGMVAGIGLFCIILFNTSCYKEIRDLDTLGIDQINADVAVPIAKAHFTLADLVGNYSDYVIEDPNTRYLTLVYEQKNLFNRTASDFIQLKDQRFLFDHWFDYTPGEPGSIFVEEYSSTQSFSLNIPSQRFYELYFNSGYIDLTLQSFIEKNSTIRINLPDLINLQTLEPVTLLFSFPYNGSLPVEQRILIPLSEHKVVFRQLPDNPNAISIDLHLSVVADAQPSAPQYMIRTDLKFINVGFQRFTGYFGNYTRDITYSLDFNLFNKWVSGSFMLDPNSIDLVVDVGNSLGIPFQITIDPFTVYSHTNPPLDIYLFGQGNPNQFMINAPDYSQMGQTVHTIIATQSNLAQAINHLPERVEIGLAATSNPAADTTVVNFVLDTSRVSLDLKVYAGLFGKINRFVLHDTLEINIEDIKYVDYLELRLHIVNGFPFEVTAQCYTTDINFRITDSLITQGNPIFKGAPVSGPPAYKVTQPAENTAVIMLDASRIRNLQNAAYLIMSAELSTTQRNWAKIYSDYTLDMKLSARAKLTFKP